MSKLEFNRDSYADFGNYNATPGEVRRYLGQSDRMSGLPSFEAFEDDTLKDPRAASFQKFLAFQQQGVQPQLAGLPSTPVGSFGELF